MLQLQYSMLRQICRCSVTQQDRRTSKKKKTTAVLNTVACPKYPNRISQTSFTASQAAKPDTELYIHNIDEIEHAGIYMI